MAGSKAGESKFRRPLLESALAIAAVTAAAAPLPAMADAFLKLGTITGESVDIKHKGEIDVLSFTQSWINTVSIGGAGGGAGAGKVQCGAVTLMKNIDASSPFLLKGVATGQHFDTAVISFRAAGSKTLTDYYTITMQEVFATELSQTDSADPDRIFEKLVLQARSFEFKYVPTNIKTGVVGKPVSFKWDCAENKGDV